MWTIEEAETLYSLRQWGAGYFGINARGRLVARPRRAGPEIDLLELSQRLQAEGLSLPTLVRFNDILRDRVDSLCAAFGEAIAEAGYGGRYTAVYPIKVNQQRSVVETLVDHGGARVGLEAGSKPELMAVLAMAPPAATIVCNGYKDREYLRLALIGQELGHQVYIVVEKLSELGLALEESERLGVVPLFGLRVRLASIGAGKWQNTGGPKSKFGLSAAQVLEMVERLRAAGRLDRLQLLHCHLGSQIANVRDIQRGMGEVARYYVELCALGAGLRVVDVGGGLGIDYDGTGSRSACSMNYSVREYANKVVHALRDACTAHALPHPDIITESGRALTAHHAMLITNVIDIDQPPGSGHLSPPEAQSPALVQDLWRVLQGVDGRNALESYHDAEHCLGEAQGMYVHGVLDLPQRARIEALYYAICQRVRPLLKAGKPEHRELFDELNQKLADKVFINLSVFQSLPDVWAIEQIFPIMPLHRLDDPPTRRAVLQDLTCDSDGKIEQYVDADGIDSTLPLHPWRPGEPYLLGVFLVGAYQEILGDMHNLFGDTDAVNVDLAPEGIRLSEPERGDTVDELLRYVHFDIDRMRAAYHAKLQAAGIEAGRAAAHLEELEAGLCGYTYLED